MEQLLLQYLANSIWQVPLLAAGAWLTLRALRPSPLLQHRVWVGALALMIAMPLLTLRVATDAPTAPALTPSAVSVDLPIPAATPIAPIEISSLPVESDPTTAPVPPAHVNLRGLSPRLPTRELTLRPWATHWIVGLYLALTAFMAIRLLSSCWLALRIVSRSAPARLNGHASALLSECCERLGVTPPNVLVSSRASSPLLVGIVRPSLLLPEDFAVQLESPTTPDRELEAIWLHELAHLRRRDYLGNLICRVAALPIAYHPATYAAQQRIRQTREMVCDAIAATEMQSHVGYARCLVGLARNMHGAIAQIEGVGILDGGVLEERIIQLIKQKATVNPRMQITRLAAGTAIVLTVLAASTMFHLTPTMAQTASTAPPLAAIAPAVPSAAAAPQPAAQNPTPAVPAALAKSSRTANPPTMSTPAAKDDTAAPDLNQQLENARKQLDQANKAYENLLRQRYAADATAATAERGAANANLNQQLADRQKRLVETLRSLTAQRNDALIREQSQIASLADANRQVGVAILNNPAFKKQLDDAATKFNSPEFKEKMEKLNKQLSEAKANSPAFKAQMERLNSPQFKKEMENAQAKFNTPEFRQKMENLNKQLAQAQAKFAADREMRMRSAVLGSEFDKQMDEVRSLIDEALKAWDAAESAPAAPVQ